MIDYLETFGINGEFDLAVIRGYVRKWVSS